MLRLDIRMLLFWFTLRMHVALANVIGYADVSKFANHTSHFRVVFSFK